MHAIVIVLLAGFSINSYNTGGVKDASEAYEDIKSGIEAGYSKENFSSFDLNE